MCPTPESSYSLRSDNDPIAAAVTSPFFRNIRAADSSPGPGGNEASPVERMRAEVLRSPLMD
jgi:hypothetical protein